MLQYLKFLSSCTLAFLCLATHAQNVFIIGSGASIQLSGNVILTLQDTDLENHGSLSLSSGNGRLIFRGSANNFIRGTGTTILDQLEIAKFANGKLLIGKNVGIRTGIWFTSGLLDLNNRVVTLSGNASLHNESENSYLTGINGGYIEITRMLNNPQSENPGNLGAMITSAQNPGQTTIRRGHQSQTVGGGLSSIHRYYDIIPENNAALSAQLRFYYRDAELNNSNEAQLDLQRSTDNSNWTNLGAHGRNASLNYVELNGVNQFSRWT
ncbi:MAG: hypothetical protein ACXWV3_09965, partial [Flavisolibacter sp.]